MHSLLIAAVLLASQSYAQFHPRDSAIDARISATMRSCMTKTGGITENMQNCLAAEYTRLDRALNRTYAIAMRATRNTLRPSQRDWLATRWVGCVEHMKRSGDGTGGDLAYRNCQLREVARRTLWLEQQMRGK
ncbi:MAG: lysozyme inhibitor LprI family protein [Pseudomonadota bacterium]